MLKELFPDPEPKKKDYNVVGFDETIIIRCRREEKAAAQEITDNNPHLYSNLSHFARACMLRGIRRQKELLDEEQQVLK